MNTGSRGPIPCTGLVLSGGGVRGAYEVGVLAGMIEALDAPPDAPAPFQVYAGTSVGAVNVAHLVAGSHRSDLEINALIRTWESLDVERYLRVHPFAPLFGDDIRSTTDRRRWRGRSVLDPRTLEALVRKGISWDAYRDNIDHGRAQAVLIAAMHVDSGLTSIFADLAPGKTYRESPNQRREVSLEAITSDHVLASASIPFLFPTRRIADRNYCDGGLRFNTPISPAIRAGAQRLVVIAVGRTVASDAIVPTQADASPPTVDPMFLAGKVLNALLLDPVEYDLSVLTRINGLMAVLDEVLPAQQRARVDAVLDQTRGTSYRRLDTLVFSPSLDIGTMAAEHLQAHRKQWKLGLAAKWLLNRSHSLPGDFVSYVLFDGAFASKLIKLGRDDARLRAGEIRSFFAR